MSTVSYTPERIGLTNTIYAISCFFKKRFVLSIICFIWSVTTEFSLSGFYKRLQCDFEDFESTRLAILEKQDYEK